MTTAADTASPAPNAVPPPLDSASVHASSHHAVTGTSFIGSSDWKMKIGLKVRRTAASTPARASAMRTPRRYVSHTTRPPNNGTTRYTADGPPNIIAIAITIGSPAG